MPARQRVFVLASGKAGTGKTTLAGYLTHAFAEAGQAVIAVDADPPRSLLEWSDYGEWELPVIGLAVRDLHRRLATVTRGYSIVVVDCPPLEAQQGIVRSALRAATDVVLPVLPSPIVLHRLAPIMETIEDVEADRERANLVRVLLNLVDVRANSGPQARQALTEDGFNVLNQHVPRREALMQSWGGSVRLNGTPFADIAHELMATKGNNK